jgi:beta-lactamase superfamily II metal-dependent hydrolase
MKKEREMFRIQMLPAGHGDCLWIEYGDPGSPHRVLIDGGVKETYRDHLKPKIEGLAAADRRFELFVLTHIDADHIEGSIELLEDRENGADFGDVWFNGWHHLPQEVLSVGQGIEFTAQIKERNLPWNTLFDEKAVMVDPDQPTLPAVTLPGGLKVTLLSPTPKELGRLKRDWDKELEESGLLEEFERVFLSAEDSGDPSDSMDIDELAASPFKKDGSKPNGSSIAMLAEFDEKRLLLAGDAHAPVLMESLRQLAREREVAQIAVDAFKIAHHGSGKNLSNDLLNTVRCRNYLVSTNGDRFHHPDHKAMARIIKNGGTQPVLLFNYRSDENQVWHNEGLMASHGYNVNYPDGDDGLVWELA